MTSCNEELMREEREENQQRCGLAISKNGRGSALINLLEQLMLEN